MNVLFLPIEIKTREFLPKLFLISRALKKNVDCFIGDKIAVNRAVRYFKRGVYFHKSINKNDKEFLKTYFDEFQKVFSDYSSTLDQLIDLKNRIIKTNNNFGKVIIVGTGGSAAIASHFSVDLTKNAKVRSINFNFISSNFPSAEMVNVCVCCN